jgi:hypothetical protein
MQERASARQPVRLSRNLHTATEINLTESAEISRRDSRFNATTPGTLCLLLTSTTADSRLPAALTDRGMKQEIIQVSGTEPFTTRYLLRSLLELESNNCRDRLPTVLARGENHGPRNSSLAAGRPHSRHTAVGHVLASMMGLRGEATPLSGR